MTIFNSYVKLPEGMFAYLFLIVFFVYIIDLRFEDVEYTLLTAILLRWLT